MINTGLNGTFNLEFRKDGVYLTVSPSMGQGLDVTVDDVMNRIKRKKIEDFNKKMIETCVGMKSGNPLKIAPEQKEQLVDASASIFVSEDKMKVSIKLHSPEGGKEFNKEELLEIIKVNNVIFGVKNDVLDNIVELPQYEKIFVIAEGQDGKNGSNGSLKYSFDTNVDLRPTVLEDGRVDYKELNFVRSVSQGQILCEALPLTMSTPGINVMGKESKCIDGKPAILPKGMNTEITADGRYLVSLLEGSVQIVDGKICVFQQFVVPNNVDVSTGNIYFVGSVLVKGNVSTGYTVEAQGDIEVEGFVEGAILKAGGNIIVKRGISGMSRGHIISGNDIVAKYIENCNVQAKRKIQAEVIMHSQIKCGEKVELLGTKGLLVGGMCRAGQEVCAKVIGSQMSTTTEIEVGTDPAAKERYIQLRNDLRTIEGDITKTDQVVSLLSKLEQSGQLSPEKKDMLVKSSNTLSNLYDTQKAWQQEFLELEDKMKEDDKGKVKVSSAIYPGTRVAIGSACYYVKDVLKGCSLQRNGEDVKVGPY